MLASLSDVFDGPTIISAVFAVAAMGLSVFLWRRGRARKALAYVVSNTSLVSIRSEAGDKIQITYEGKPVKGVHLVSFSLSNVGNQPVLQEDFNRPIAVGFGSNAVPLTVEVKDAHPPKLEPIVEAEPSRIVLKPLLLNPGDRFTIAALVRDFEGSLEVDEGRIAGVKKLVRTSPGAGVSPSLALELAWPMAALLVANALAAFFYFVWK